MCLATEDLDVHLKLMEMIQMVRGPEWMGAEDVRAKVLAGLGPEDRAVSTKRAACRSPSSDALSVIREIFWLPLST